MTTTFNAIKQTDRRRIAEVSSTTYILIGGMPKQGSTVTLKSVGRPLGTNRVTLFNRTTGFRPGVFSVNPFDARGFESQCNSTGSQCYALKTMTETFVSQELYGPLAALLAQPNSDLTAAVDREVYAESAAAQAAVAKVATPDVDAGMILGDAKNTLRFAMSPLKSIAKTLKKMEVPRTLLTKWAFDFAPAATVKPKKNLDPHWNPSAKRIARRLGRSGEYAANAWLQYRYGLMPTVFDFNDSVKKFHQGFETITPAIRTKGRKLVVRRTDVTTEGVRNASGFYGYFRERTVDTTTAHARFYYRYTYDDMMHEARSLGMTMYDIPGLIYEFTPFSFMLDWVFDVGTWLKAIQPSPSRLDLGFTTGTKQSRNYSLDLLATSQNYDMSYAGNCWSSYNATTDSYLRTLGTTPLLTPRVNFDAMSLAHTIDTLSLIWQTIPKIWRR